MKSWGIIVAGLYVLILAALLLVLVSVMNADSVTPLGDKIGYQLNLLFSPGDSWTVWIYFGVLFLAQVVLLSVPVAVAQKRPVTRRSVIPLALTASMMTGLLAAGAVLAVEELLKMGKGTQGIMFVVLGVSGLLWAWWAVVFFRWSKNQAAADWVSRQCRVLFRGSILQLLIVVPSHIIVRQRDYCCAGMQTFIGIAFGLSVMLFTFGPGVFFLFAERWRHLRKKS